MGGKDKHLGYLDVSRRVSSKDGYIGNVITSQWLDALIDMGSPVVVAMETGVAEVRLNKTWLQVGNADSRIGHIDAEPVRQCFHGSLRGAIHITASVCCITGH